MSAKRWTPAKVLVATVLVAVVLVASLFSIRAAFGHGDATTTGEVLDDTGACMVSFTDPEGIPHHFTFTTGKGTCSYDEGDRVTVHYDPKDPDRAGRKPPKAWLMFIPVSMILAGIVWMICFGTALKAKGRVRR